MPVGPARRLTAIALTMGAALIVTGTAAASGGDGSGERGGSRFSAGIPGAGDSYFSVSGNGGFDVAHDDLDLKTNRPPTPMC